MDYQNLIIMGRAVDDAREVEAKNSDKKFASFTVAVNRYLGKEKGQEVTYYDCLLFGTDAQTAAVAKKVAKGELVVVQGRPEVDAYINKNKEAQGRLNVVVDDWQVLSANKQAKIQPQKNGKK